ncbi:olfactory receptor 7G2-like [Erinaceus europaeus]|uniref:Olfactory receptor n=1 Tax=Erinaceus europaeus TaxID=9365 RepID=A0A1S2ZXB0_ERIEU|nr:olfactory receptor 7G2-like [Erinaceus europaeus]
METRNRTDDPVFFLMGFTEDPALQSLLFCLFLVVYLVTILGNLLIILAVISDSPLHTPMYFFLSNLSLNDICVSTTTLPKMLVNMQTQDLSITYLGCLSQTTFVQIFLGLENCLLGVMAYDRFVAICHPLRYTVIMNPCHCSLLMALSLFLSLLDALIHTLLALKLSFCLDLEVPQFFCELAQLLNLACSDTFINHLLIYVMAVFFGGIPLSGIIFSYTRIISSVLKMHSREGKLKAFSTCGSHLSVVSLFYGTCIGVYFTSEVIESSGRTTAASAMYIIVPQMMNPFIYSLRNQDVKDSLRKLFRGRPFFPVT